MNTKVELNSYLKRHFLFEGEDKTLLESILQEHFENKSEIQIEKKGTEDNEIKYEVFFKTELEGQLFKDGVKLKVNKKTKRITDVEYFAKFFR